MKSVQFFAFVAGLVLSNAALAHHSDAGLDDTTVVVLDGTITEFSWRQPHVYFSVEVIENGEPVVWDIQMAGVNSLARRGWSADSLAGRWTSRRPGGAPRPQPQPENDPDGPLPCNTGFDCFFRTNLVLTEAGKAAAEAFDPLSTENPEATCVGRPTPSALVSAGGYLLEFDLSDEDEKILIRSEWFNEERTIWMDGRPHPDPSETLATGHSIGHWEGDTLVIDTRNFDFHRSPYQVGVPSGSQKHVVERYRLNDDGRSMQAEFTLEDPEYIAQPFTNRKTLYYVPHMQMYATDCDIRNTSRFLDK